MDGYLHWVVFDTVWGCRSITQACTTNLDLLMRLKLFKLLR